MLFMIFDMMDVCNQKIYTSQLQRIRRVLNTLHKAYVVIAIFRQIAFACVATPLEVFRLLIAKWIS